MKLRKFFIILFLCLAVLGFGYYFGTNNMDRITLGANNYGTDPYPTADICFQNLGYISNYNSGTFDIGGVNFLNIHGSNLNSVRSFAFNEIDSVRCSNILTSHNNDTINISSCGSQIAIRGPNSDTVKTILGGAANEIYIFQAADSSKTLIKGNNLLLSSNFTFANNKDRLVCISDGMNLIQISSSSNH